MARSVVDPLQGVGKERLPKQPRTEDHEDSVEPCEVVGERSDDTEVTRNSTEDRISIRYEYPPSYLSEGTRLPEKDATPKCGIEDVELTETSPPLLGVPCRAKRNQLHAFAAMGMAIHYLLKCVKGVARIVDEDDISYRMLAGHPGRERSSVIPKAQLSVEPTTLPQKLLMFDLNRRCEDQAKRRLHTRRSRYSLTSASAVAGQLQA
ncbi:hypothetical protein KBZ18_16020 [Synechococcus sp. Cruz-9H2]|uniref:hypothetical protein n=1 Tax=unclassified Synechococcus TaxID=2626047 RepID=UPI0020CFB59B|nr:MULTISPECIES: hypothetical protein [unclassified Synechococcus]MCP9820987.1 hypothetical protein [Synechococcus sp. Cruz-9H2]MCP9845225.1 hypothetical protein [Synechococcus sp. Edmonson 11F2]MCP9857396.1 hypothetical protein [Synechococcus sp. Cruz-9C9]MCP9864641.1 hypothetical protein [Synechococcus sp. Cruz-7E5]MCP9871908.1 hypothetical protein [Synechococcus sp. Cruz-7B9]